MEKTHILYSDSLPVRTGSTMSFRGSVNILSRETIGSYKEVFSWEQVYTKCCKTGNLWAKGCLKHVVWTTMGLHNFCVSCQHLKIGRFHITVDFWLFLKNQKIWQVGVGLHLCRWAVSEAEKQPPTMHFPVCQGLYHTRSQTLGYSFHLLLKVWDPWGSKDTWGGGPPKATRGLASVLRPVD